MAATKGEYWILKRSGIHQKGMFARKDIPKGTRIIEYIGEFIDKEESERRCLEQEAKGRKSGGAMVYVFDLNDQFDLDGNIPDNPAKFINHGCEENCEAVNEEDRIFIYAKEDISGGDELLFDYGYDIEHWEDHPCLCGSPRCVGYIVSKGQRTQLKKKLKHRERRQKLEEKAREREEREALREAEREAKRKQREQEKLAKKKAAAKAKKEADKARKVAKRAGKKVAARKEPTPARKSEVRKASKDRKPAKKSRKAAATKRGAKKTRAKA